MADETIYILPDEATRRPLTARNLEDYALCPCKYLLSFFEPREATRRFLGGPAALGGALRRALIEFHRLGGAEVARPAALFEAFEEAWDGSLCADSREEEQLHREGLTMLTAYWDREHASPTPVVAVDVRMEQQLGEQRFVAVADRVDAPEEGRVRLVRFTSARRPPSPTTLREDVSYLLLALIGSLSYPDAAISVACLSLRDGRLAELAVTPAELRDFEAAVLRRAAAIRGDTAFAPRKGAHCRWCRSHQECPAWHGRSA